MYLPRPVTELAAKRVEGDVVLQFKVPAANTDGSTPADLDRIEVYAHTGPLPAPADYVKYGTRVQSIEIKQPVIRKPEEEKEQSAESKEQRAEPAAPNQSAELAADLSAVAPQGAKAEAGMIEQGWATSVRETLTEKHMEIGPMPPTRPVVPPATPVQILTLETPGTENFAMPVSRYYTVVGVSRSRHRRGPFAGPIRVPLVSPLEPPDKVDTDYTETAISLTWPGQSEDVLAAPTAAGAAPSVATGPASPVAAAVPGERSNQETPGTYEIYADVETEGTEDAPRPGPGAAPTSKPQPPPTPRFGYNVYDASTVHTAIAAPVAPLNATLLTAPRFSDPRVEFGTERCYIVRRVEMVGTTPIESAASAPACVTPADKFPPAAPKAVTSVASGTAVSLIWDANIETDLGGYLVLRGEAPGDTLAPLTPEPIGDTSYVDTSVRRNRTYVYEVIAVDKTGNQSAPSNRVEEPIR